MTWPPDFESYSWEVESKGRLSELEILSEGKTIRPVFYDPARLAQDVVDEVTRSGVFAEPNLVVIPAVTREIIESTVAVLAESGELKRLFFNGFHPETPLS